MPPTTAIHCVTAILSFAYVFQACASLPATSQPTSRQKEWFELESKQTLQTRLKRLADSGAFQRQALQKEDKKYQSCIAPGNRQGHCKHLGQCTRGEFRANLTRIVDHMCIIENAFVGICCPDDLNKTPKPSSITQKLFVESLPIIADDEMKYNVSGETEGNEASNFGKSSTRIRGCGVSTKSKTKLVGGQPADPKEWPWMAAILKEDDIQYCGGVLITDRHVLTAAHCVYKHKPRDVKVRLGEYDFTTDEETRAQDSVATEIRVHRNFDASTNENDIAIIKIQRPAVFNTYVWPVCLPPVGLTFENENAIVTGWGTQYYGGPASTVLMEVPVPLWSHDKCASSFTQRIPETALCAGAHEGGRDACQGDSGGPLLYRLRNGRWITIGIVSWGIRCGEPGHPGIYTKVNSYLDWIFANTAF